MIGRAIGRYRILSKLGEGGMGTVWRAEDPLLQRTIALKFLSLTLSDSPEARERFLREARAASALHHSGIATVFDVGEVENQIYIAMHMVEGETLSAKVKRGALPVAEAVRIAIEAGTALAHAHAHGVLHRDVSSRNIMVDREGQVVVVDFGLALPEGTSKLTQTGAWMGTLAYVAPEVLLGKKADARSDLYSLGVVLYEMLTGRLPFTGERRETVMYAAVHQDPVPPSRDFPGVSAAVDTVVLRALSKDPDRRHASAEEFVEELQLVEVSSAPAPAGRRVRASGGALRPVSQPPSQPSARRSALRTWRAWIAVALLVSLSVVVVRLWPRPHSSLFSGNRVAVLPLRNLSADAASSNHIGTGIASNLVAKLTNLGGAQVIPWITSERYADAARPVEEIADELRVDALVVGTFQLASNRVHVSIALVDTKSGTQQWTDEFEEPHDDLLGLQGRIALAAAEQLKGRLSGSEKSDLRRPISQSAEAHDSYLRGVEAFRGEGEQSTAVAYDFFARAVQLDPDFAEGHVALAAVHSDRFFYGWGGAADLDSAEAHYKVALRLKPRLHAARGGMARVYWERGQSEKCLRLAAAHDFNAMDIEGLFVLGEIYFFSGLYDKAVDLFEQVLEQDPASQGAAWLLVVAAAWDMQLEKAIQAAEQYFQRFGPNPEVHTWVGFAYHMLGDYEQAEVFYGEAIRMFGDDTNLYVSSLAGELQRQLGDMEAARGFWRHGQALAERMLARAPDNFRIRLQWADFAGALGDGAGLFKVSQAILDNAMPHGEWTYPTAIRLARLGEAEKAVAVLREILRDGTYRRHMEWPIELWAGKEMLDHPGFREFLDENDALGRRLAGIADSLAEHRNGSRLRPKP